MKRINEFDTVCYVGPFDRDLALASGEAGIVLDDYGDGNCEVEFALPDGTTWLQCALPKSQLEKFLSATQVVTPSAASIYSAVRAFEGGDDQEFEYPPTGEKLSVLRGDDGRLLVTTPSLGVVTSLTRPK